LVGTMLARGTVHVLRLSMLFALLDHRTAVDVPHLTAASAWWDYARASVERIFAGRTGNDDADRILAETSPGDTRTLTQLREEVFGGHIAAGRLSDAVALLVQRGEARCAKQRTGGRPCVMVERLAPAGGDGAAA